MTPVDQISDLIAEIDTLAEGLLDSLTAARTVMLAFEDPRAGRRITERALARADRTLPVLLDRLRSLNQELAHG